MATASASAASAASSHLDAQQLLDHVRDLRFLRATHAHHRELDGARRVFVHAQRRGTAASAAPRAWPSLSALSAFLERNTRSTAISCGRVLRDQLRDRAWIDAQPIGERPPEVAMQPCATMCSVPPRNR